MTCLHTATRKISGAAVAPQPEETATIEKRAAARAGAAQVPATEVLLTDEPVTTESMTRSRSKTTEKPL